MGVVSLSLHFLSATFFKLKKKKKDEVTEARVLGELSYLEQSGQHRDLCLN